MDLSKAMEESMRKITSSLSSIKFRATLALLFTLGFVSNALADNSIITANQNVFVDSADSVKTFGGYFQTSDTKIGLVEFDLSAIPVSATIVSAELTLTTKARYSAASANVRQATASAYSKIDNLIQGSLLWSDIATVNLSQSYTPNETVDASVTVDVASIIVLGSRNLLQFDGGSAQIRGYNSEYPPSIAIEYTLDSVPSGTALLTPSHVLMNAKGYSSANGGNSQVFTLSNSEATNSAVVYSGVTSTVTIQSGDYSLDDSDCVGKTLYAEQSCEIVLTLDSTGDADRAALLQVSTDVGTSVAYIAQHESATEQAERRLPPVVVFAEFRDNTDPANKFNVAGNADIPAGPYYLVVELDGYNTDSDLWAAVYECTPASMADESCGTGTPLVSKALKRQSTSNGSISYTGKSFFNTVSATNLTTQVSSKYKFNSGLTLPAYDHVNNSLIMRLFYRTALDTNAGNRPVSVLFTGAHSLGADTLDSLGRKLIISQ